MSNVLIPFLGYGGDSASHKIANLAWLALKREKRKSYLRVIGQMSKFVAIDLTSSCEGVECFD